jgi:SAM-dependent methyltransferase
VDWGIAGEEHGTLIQKVLQTVPRGGRVLNAGCGPFRQMAWMWPLKMSNPPRLLVAADAAEGSFNQRHFESGPGVDVVYTVGDMRRPPFREGAFDAILALGLFGDLRWPAGTRLTSQREGLAWSLILRRLRALLRPEGHLLVSNSLVRQPKGRFLRIADRAGFLVADLHEQNPAGADARYLVVFGPRGQNARKV